MSLLAGKIGIVFGVANKRSIAWAIAQAWQNALQQLSVTASRLKDEELEAALLAGLRCVVRAFEAKVWQ